MSPSGQRCMSLGGLPGKRGPDWVGGHPPTCRHPLFLPRKRACLQRCSRHLLTRSEEEARSLTPRPGRRCAVCASGERKASVALSPLSLRLSVTGSQTNPRLTNWPTFKNTISHKNSQHLSENRILWPPGPTVPMQAGTFPGPPAASARAPWTRGGDPVSGARSRSGSQTPGREPRALLHGGSVCALPRPVSMTLCLGPPRRAGAAGAAPLRPAPQQPACALRDGARPQKSAPSQLEPVRTPLSFKEVGCPGGLQPGEGAGEGAGEQPPRQGMEQP